MNFAFCLIAKNEAKTLPRLLESLKAYKEAGGNIYLLDTGSTDGTAELARTLGCVVKEVGDKYKHTISMQDAWAINDKFVVPEENNVVMTDDTYFDFGSARNDAASMSHTDMVSFVDADEVLKSLDFNAINKLIEDGYDQFEYSFVFAHDKEGRPAVEFTQSKFYNRTKMEWRGIIHEVLQGVGNRRFLTKEQFGLEHYQNESTNRSGYLRGLAVDCYNNPTNDRNSHYFARECMWTDRPRSAIAEFERHVKMNGWPAEKAQSYIFMGDCYGKIGELEKQVECYAKAYHIEPNRRCALLRLANFYLHHQQWQAAVVFAKGALEIPWMGGFYAEDKAEYEHIPHEILYRAYGWLGRIKEAQEHIMICNRYQPYNLNFLMDTKYYFEYQYPDIDGWMRWEELLWLYETAKGRPKILELGSWKGRSTHALLSGNKKGTVTAVDTWKGSKDLHDHTSWMAQQEDILGIFLKNVGDFGNLAFIQMKGHEAADHIKDDSMDMVFIDAGHSYEEVKQDIADWLPKVKRGGILCGHDYLPGTWMGVIQAVDEAFGKPDEIHGTIWVHYVNPHTL